MLGLSTYLLYIYIQLRDIMVQISNFATIADYLKSVSVDGERTTDPSTIPSQFLKDYYIREPTDLSTLDLALCDWDSSSWTDKHLIEIIHGDHQLISGPWGQSYWKSWTRCECLTSERESRSLQNESSPYGNICSVGAVSILVIGTG